MKTTDTTNHDPQPPAELIDDIRKRLADIPQEIVERAHHAFRHQPIQHAGSILYKAGLCLSSHELYEYRKTLFPPNALVDPYTQGPPILSPASADGGCGEAQPQRSPTPSTSDAPNPPVQPINPITPIIHNPEPDRSPDSFSASDEAPPPNDNQQLHQARQHLVQLLSARAQQTTDHGPDVPSSSSSFSNSFQHNGPRTTDSKPLMTDNGSLMTGSALLSDLRDLINRYVVLPDMAAETLALWVVHTHAFTLREVTTYIGVVSPEKRCGKTTLLDLLRSLAHEAVAAANISPPALFRVIEEEQPTLIIDEADTFLQNRDEMAGILNAGYRKGNSYVVRVGDGKLRKGAAGSSKAGSQLARYSCWCPKVMAAIGHLPDTLADRCIVITMQRKMPGEKCERLRELDATEYRQRCADFVRGHSEAIGPARPEIPSKLNDRAADIWEPLLAIADLAGGGWPELARQAAEKLSTAYDDDVAPIGYLVQDIRNWLVAQDLDRIFCRNLVDALNAVHDRPWEDLRRGRKINEWWLGRLLSGLGVQSKAMRVNDTVAKGYTLTDIEAAFRRYVPNPDLHAQSRPTPAPDRSPATDDDDTNDNPDPKIEKDLTKLMRKLLGPHAGHG